MLCLVTTQHLLGDGGHNFRSTPDAPWKQTIFSSPDNPLGANGFGRERDLPRQAMDNDGAIMGLLLWAAMFTWNTARAETPKVTLHVENIVPRFMKFYRAADSGNLDPAQRWTLWQKDDGIAAVPPTPLGKHLAHKRLKKGWSKYQASVTRYPGNAARAATLARTILPEVAHLLKAGQHPVTVDLVLFVGEYSGNAFTVPGNPPPYTYR